MPRNPIVPGAGGAPGGAPLPRGTVHFFPAEFEKTCATMGAVPASRLRAALPIAVCGSFTLGMALSAGSASRQPSGDDPAPDARGCCILKPLPDKKAWEFHKKHKCADFRAESQR